MSDKLDDVDTWAHGVCASFIRERDGLRAEVERLRNQHRNDRVLLAHATSAEVAMLKQDLAQSRAENERLDKQWREIVERLRAALQGALDDWYPGESHEPEWVLMAHRLLAKHRE